MGGRDGASTTLAAILFTDIVGSTELRSTLGEDAADDLRRRHEADLTAAVEGNQGRVVKTLGDGVMAVFDGVADAVAAGVAAQQATADPLHIRVGISAGDVVVEDGDAHGTPVIEAARLCNAAESDQILCSAPVQWLSRGRGGHAFRIVGDLDLKGLAEPVPTLEVRWEPATPTSAAPALPAALAGDARFPFVGREVEREALRTAWKLVATEGGQRVVLIAGEPGVGKTRLAGEVARSALEDGGRVLFGRCDEELGTAFQPFAEALRTDLATIADAPDGRLGARPGELTRLQAAVGLRWPDLPAPTESDAETERVLLFDAVASWLGDGDEPTLLVLDDLHWAAKPTLLLLRHLLRAEAAQGLLIVATYRDTDLDRGHPLGELLADLRREAVVDRFALRGLDAAGVAAFLAAAGGHDLDDRGEALAAAIAAETEGNPFFVGEILSHLVESGALYVEDGRWTSDRTVEEMAIPEGVRDVVGRRLSRLSDTANDVLRRAAVIGPVFEIAVLTAVCDEDEDAVVDAVEEAVAAGLARESDEVLGYRFAHALVRSTLYEELPTVRRVRLHGRVVDAIEQVHAARLDGWLADLAHHSAEAAAMGDTAKAVAYARRAGRSAEEAGGPDEAVRWYRRALELHDAESGTDASPERVDLLIDAGRAEWGAGEPSYRATLLEASAAAEALDDGPRMATAALSNSRGGFSAWGEVDTDRVAATEAALAAAGDGDSEDRALLLANLAAELTFDAPIERRRALLDDAEAIARRIGSAVALAKVLLVRDSCVHEPSLLDERTQDVRELEQLAGTTGDPMVQAYALWAKGSNAIERGDGATFRQNVAALDTLAARLNRPVARWWAGCQRSSLHILDCDLEALVTSAEEAFAFGAGAEQHEAFGNYTFCVGFARIRQGRTAEVLELADATHPEGWAEGRGEPLAAPAATVWALVLVNAGRLEHAAAVLDHARPTVADIVEGGPFWPSGLNMWSWAVAPLGRVEEAEAIYETMAPLAGQMTLTGGSMPNGAVDLALGRLAPLLGRHDVVDGHFEAARDLHARLAAPLFLSETYLEWGRAKLAVGDEDAARPFLEQARDLGREHAIPRSERVATELLGGPS
jgi:class 3 adenylate cyclase